MAYRKKGYHTPEAIAARMRGAATMRSRRFIKDRTSCSVDKETKYRAVALYGNVHNALVFAIEHAPSTQQTETTKTKE